MEPPLFDLPWWPTQTHLVLVLIFGGGWVASLIRSEPPPDTRARPAVAGTLGWVTLTLGFAGWLHIHHGDPSAAEGYHPAWAAQFLTGWVLSVVLGVDSLGTFAKGFEATRIPGPLQPRILRAGVPLMAGFTAVFVAIATDLLESYGIWAELLFAAFALWAAHQIARGDPADTDVRTPADMPLPRLARRWLPEVPELDGDRFFVDRAMAEAQAARGGAIELRPGTRRWMTPAFLTLLGIEHMSAMFMLDAVPPVVAIAREPLVCVAGLMFGEQTVRSAYLWRATLSRCCVHIEKAVVALLVLVGVVTLARAAAQLGVAVPWWSQLDEVTHAHIVLAFTVGSVGVAVAAARVFPAPAAKIQHSDGGAAERPEVPPAL